MQLYYQVGGTPSPYRIGVTVHGDGGSRRKSVSGSGRVMKEKDPSSQNRNADRTPQWRLPDLIDFEYLLHSDLREETVDEDQRDRRVYLDEVQPFEPGGSQSPTSRRRWLFWHWLRASRSSLDASELLPGNLFSEVYPLIRTLLIAIGLIFGAGAAATCLAYDGRQPVNVAQYFGVLIVSQILLSVGALLLFGLRAQGRLVLGASIWQSILQPLIGRAVRWLHRHALDRRPANERNKMRSFIGFVGGRHSLFNSVFYWPVLVAIQIFGVSFNIGILAATLALVTFSDRAFGWQSAVQFDSESVHSLVRTVALPWSWAFPEGTGYPTLEQVHGTRIVLKDGIRELATKSLVSWWPFLCFGVFVYGFIPRLLLFLGSLAAYRSNLRRLDFSYVECDRLFERMTTPCIRTSASSDEGRQISVHERPPEVLQDKVSAGPCAVFFPSNFKDRLDREDLRNAISEQFRWTVWKTLEIRKGQTADRGVANALGGLAWPDGQERVLILHEAWRPPIDEFLEFVRLVRGALSVQARITIGLFGKPLSGNKFAHVKDTDLRVWKQIIDEVGDPYLRLEKLLPYG